MNRANSGPAMTAVGKPDDQRVEQGAAGIGMELRHRGDRPGMRRHQAMRGRESGHERQSEPQQRRAGLSARP